MGQQLAQLVSPELHAASPPKAGRRIETKIGWYMSFFSHTPSLLTTLAHRLKRKWQQQVKRLRTTGEGIGGRGGTDENDDSQLPRADGSFVTFMSPEGPTSTTPAHAQNIWCM